jgi:hypothetical protein
VNLKLLVRRWVTPTVAAVCAVVLLPCGMASADYFGGPYADSLVHTYCSIESNDADRQAFRPQFNHSMNHLENVTTLGTDLVDCPTYAEDVYWYVAPASDFSDPDALAGTLCMVPLASNKCDTFRIRFNKAFINRTDTQRRHTACHEISHSVGSDDGSTASNGCFPQSTHSNGTTHTTHEINHINNQYS